MWCLMQDVGASVPLARGTLGDRREGTRGLRSSHCCSPTTLLLQVRIKLKHMEVEIRRRETTGAGTSAHSDTETLAKYEIMDGAPVRGESIPIRCGGGGGERREGANLRQRGARWSRSAGVDPTAVSLPAFVWNANDDCISLATVHGYRLC